MEPSLAISPSLTPIPVVEQMRILPGILWESGQAMNALILSPQPWPECPPPKAYGLTKIDYLKREAGRNQRPFQREISLLRCQ